MHQSLVYFSTTHRQDLRCQGFKHYGPMYVTDAIHLLTGECQRLDSVLRQLQALSWLFGRLEARNAQTEHIVLADCLQWLLWGCDRNWSRERWEITHYLPISIGRYCVIPFSFVLVCMYFQRYKLMNIFGCILCGHIGHPSQIARLSARLVWSVRGFVTTRLM